jgi:hypothetical protein
MTLSGGTVHPLPADLRKAISSTPKVQALWQDISPLARNEWICWVISGKKAETRGIRIGKAISKMKGGMRRPCCWIGCIHRTDKPVSRSVQYVLDKKSK